MQIDVYTATGTKKGTADLPGTVFEAPINEGLMHQALVRQQSNRRQAIAHVKSRGEVRGSTAKLFAQKGTGRARRGSVRAPVLRGGGKAFGPRNRANYQKDMPLKMRRAALRSCLSMQAKNGVILGLESYPEEIKTKKVAAMLEKMPVELGRRTLIVMPEANTALQLSARNIPGVKTVQAAYLNPEDVLGSHHIIFLVDAIPATEAILGKTEAKKAAKKTTTKKTPAKKADTSDSDK